MKASENKWVNSIINMVGIKSLRLGGQIMALKLRHYDFKKKI